MQIVVINSWVEIWERGKSAECTHYNYSRGEKRFRGILEEPLPIGEEPNLEDSQKIRIRFFTLINDEYVENEELDCWYHPKKDNSLEVPPDFESWTLESQSQFIRVSMERISANRYLRQMDSADRLYGTYLNHLLRQIDKKDKLIADLYKENAELNAARGIQNIYEFLVHPNANQIVQTIMENFKTTDTNRIMGELQKIAGAKLKSDHGKGDGGSKS